MYIFRTCKEQVEQIWVHKYGTSLVLGCTTIPKLGLFPKKHGTFVYESLNGGTLLPFFYLFSKHFLNLWFRLVKYVRCFVWVAIWVFWKHS